MSIPDVTRDDVAARYEGNLDTDFRSDYVDAQIGDAVSYVSTHWRAQVDDRLASGALDSNLYKRIIASAVLRVIRNPDGFASEGEGGYNNSRFKDVASGALGFTSDDIDTLIGSQMRGVPGTIGLGLDYGWG